MAYNAGYNGSMTLNSITLPTVDAKITERNRLGETTNSSTSGRATWLGTVSEADFSCGVVFDDATLLSANGITVGSAVTVDGKLGNSSKHYTGTVVIETVEHTWSNKEGVVLASVTGKFSGAITRPS